MEDNLYQQSDNDKDIRRTYVPGLYRKVKAEAQTTLETGERRAPRYIILQERPIIGVLYSISGGLEGELFPVYVGRNTIGSGENCDICLREASVASCHALLLARKIKDKSGHEQVSVNISDEYSSTGTAINGHSIDQEDDGLQRRPCRDGDMIRIGKHYELVLSLFNANEKLTNDKDFNRLPEPKSDYEIAPVPMQPYTASLQKKKEPPVEASPEFYKRTKSQGVITINETP